MNEIINPSNFSKNIPTFLRMLECFWRIKYPARKPEVTKNLGQIVDKVKENINQV